MVNQAPGEQAEPDGAHRASRRRTLLMVTPYFPPGGGGLEQYVFRLASQLQRRHDWRVVVATSGDQRSPDRQEITDGLTIYRLGYIFKISNTPFDPRWARRLRSIVERENPDLVDAHLPVPGLADAMAHVVGSTPFVVTYHTNTMLKGKLRFDIPIWLYERIIGHRILARAERIICSSTAVRDFLAPYAGKSLVIPPAVDVEEFVPGTPLVGRRLLFVGNLTRAHSHKGLHYLLEALAEAPCRQAGLDVVGDGDARPAYEEQCQRLGIGDRVRFHGRLSGTALVTRYQESYALVQPSTNDSVPTTVVEAMACGLPVIASDVGGIPSLVREGVTGRLVPPADVASLARAVAELYSDPATAIKHGQAGRAVIESHLTVQEQADRTEAVFEEILGRSGGGTVAVVTPYYYPWVGGLENYARQTVRTLRAAGYRVVVITSGDRGWRRVTEEVDGVRVHRLPRLGRVLNTPLHPLWPVWLGRLFAREGVTIINAHTPVPVMADAARMARGRRPLVITYHNDLVKNGFLGRLLCQLEHRFLTSQTLAAADEVVVTSEHYAWRSPRLRAVRDKLTISAPGVDTDLFRSTRMTSGPVPARLIFVGQLDRTHRHKGLDRLLEALVLARREVPGLSLEVVGRGNDQRRYADRAQAMGLGDSVSFAGFVPDETLRDLYSAASAVVLPANHDAEGFGMVILEAAACGTPAVATAVGGVPAAVLDGVTGLLVPPGDTAALAAALVRITQDRRLRERLAEGACSRARRGFTWSAQGAALVTLIRTMTLGRGHPGTSAPRGSAANPRSLT